MNSILEYINHEGDRNLAMEALKAGFSGLSYDDSIFTQITEEELPELVYEASKSYNHVNEAEERNILDCIRDAANGQEVDEGIIAGVLGGLAGVAVGPKVGEALCAALNVQKGVFYDLLTSRIVTGAICAKLGLRA